MLRLSKKADYALMAMKHLATRPDAASASAREIAEQYDIPIELMAKVLQRLARRGLLTSHQGTRGGYRLARACGAISVADIIQAIDGPLTVTACSTEDGELRPVRQVQRPRSALAHQGSDPVGAGDCSLQEVAGRAAGGRAGGRRSAFTQTRRAEVLIVAARSTSTTTPRRRSIRACSRRCCRTSPSSSAIPPAGSTPRVGGAEGGRHGAHAGRRADQARPPARSSSRAAPPSRTISRSRAWPARLARSRRSHRSPSATEHKSVLDSCARLEHEGWRVTRLGVDSRRLHRSRRAARGDDRPHGPGLGHGGQQRDRRAAAARRDCAPSCSEHGGLLHTDAAQAAGKVPLDVDALGRRSALADRRTSATARRAPARSTCAGRSRGCQLECQIDGGGHENGLRSGTLNVPGIVGLGACAEMCREEMLAEESRGWRRCATGCSRGFAGNLDGSASNGCARSAAAAQPPRQLRRRRRRGAADGARRSRGVDRFGVQLRQPGAVARPAGDRRGRRARRRIHPLRARTHDHRCGHRLRDRTGRRPSSAPARAAPLMRQESRTQARGFAT